MTQPTLQEIWATIAQVVGTASGLPVIWAWQSADQPGTDYVRLSLGAFIPEGYDYTLEQAVPDWQPLTAYQVGDRVVNGPAGNGYVCTQAGTSAAAGGPTGTTRATAIDGSAAWVFVSAHQGVAVSLGGQREVALQLEVFSAAVVEEAARATALATCDLVVSRLRLPAARSALAAVHFVPFDPGAVNYLPTLVAANFRGRAVCDVRCRMPARALVEYADHIARVSVSVQAANVAGVITQVVAAP